MSFEPLPWNWPAAARNQQDVHVWYLYTWRVPDCAMQNGMIEKRSLVSLPLMHALDRRRLRAPFPDEISVVNLGSKLHAAAASATEIWKAPCKYIGLHIESDTNPMIERFEPNPAKWPRSLTAKSEAVVYYEWEHVSIGPACKPHRVGVRVYDAIRGESNRIPNCPLRSQSTPSGLTFTLAFMNAVAKNVQDGCEFAGIVFENAELALQKSLPNDGIDLQDEPVYWTMSNGQTLCRSVRQLARAKADELTEGDPSASYASIAQEFNYHCLGIPIEDGS